MNWVRLGAAIAILSLVTACATPETRVRKGLIRAGLPEPLSRCMASRMVDKLSLLQLNRLNGLAALKDKQTGKLDLAEFTKKTKALQDPEIVSVVTSSGIVCAING